MSRIKYGKKTFEILPEGRKIPKFSVYGTHKPIKSGKDYGLNQIKVHTITNQSRLSVMDQTKYFMSEFNQVKV